MKGLEGLRSIGRSPVTLALTASLLLLGCSKSNDKSAEVQHAIRIALDNVYAKDTISCNEARAQISSELEAAGFKRTADGKLVEDDIAIDISVSDDVGKNDNTGSLLVEAEGPEGLIIGKSAQCSFY